MDTSYKAAAHEQAPDVRGQITLAGVEVAGVPATPAPAGEPAALLDQERDNRFGSDGIQLFGLREGDYVISPVRSGAGFDPMGCRAADVNRLDDAVAVVKSLPGRWLMVTLTVNRRLWLGPEHAYQRCNERVRRVAAAVSERGIWFAGYEVQTKTGEGWPHWHVMVWAPDNRSAAEIRRAVERAWVAITEHVDTDTGEVTRSVESIGFVHVAEAQDRVGLGTYVAKYVVKRWEAVPAWMGESRRRWRKFRASPGFYDVLERLYRHDRHRGSRPEPSSRRLRTRTLYQRMAASGTRANVFQYRAGRMHFDRTLPVVFADGEGLSEFCRRYPVRYGMLGRWHRMRLLVDAQAMRYIERDRLHLERHAAEVYKRRLSHFRSSWSCRHDQSQTEGITLDGGASQGPADAVGCVMAPSVEGVTLRVEFSTGKGDDRPTSTTSPIYHPFLQESSRAQAKAQADAADQNEVISR